MKAILSSLLVTSCLAGLVACGGQGSGSPENVILISIDTLRPDYLGCYGYERDTSPALDSLAEAGTLFEDVTSGSPWTLPGHATMLTGLFPSSHGVKDHVNTLEAETLPTILQAAGFQTMGIVNSHNIGTEHFGLMRGYDEGLKKYFIEMDPPEGGPILNRGEEITAQAVEWLEERDGRRFFMFLHYYDVHTDFTPKPKYKAQFVDPYEGKLAGRHGTVRTGTLIKWRNAGVVPSEADIRYMTQMYDAEIRQLDDVLAGFFEFLEESGLADDTLVVISSDHGEEFYEHEGLLHGRTQYQELLAIPLIMSGPGVPAGLRVDFPVHQVDIAPTILSLLGIESKDPVDGLDLSNVWRNPAALPDLRLLYGEADHNNVVEGDEVVDIKKMVRLKHDKLLFDTHTELAELYDLSQDPLERDNLVGREKERAEALMEKLRYYMENAQPGKIIPPPTKEEQEKLRALGY